MSRIKPFALAAVVAASISLGAQNSTMRPPITGIAKVSVYASNLDKSKQFYGNFLGFPQIGATSGNRASRISCELEAID